MIYLMQILNLLNKEQIELFESLFLEFEEDEIEELGYKNSEPELFNSMLLNHFGLTIECEVQLKSFTELLLNRKDSAKSAISITKLKKGIVV